MTTPAALYCTRCHSTGLWHLASGPNAEPSITHSAPDPRALYWALKYAGVHFAHLRIWHNGAWLYYAP